MLWCKVFYFTSLFKFKSNTSIHFSWTWTFVYKLLSIEGRYLLKFVRILNLLVPIRIYCIIWKLGWYFSFCMYWIYFYVVVFSTCYDIRHNLLFSNSRLQWRMITSNNSNVRRTYVVQTSNCIVQDTGLFCSSLYDWCKVSNNVIKQI